MRLAQQALARPMSIATPDMRAACSRRPATTTSTSWPPKPRRRATQPRCACSIVLMMSLRQAARASGSHGGKEPSHEDRMRLAQQAMAQNVGQKRASRATHSIIDIINPRSHH